MKKHIIALITLLFATANIGNAKTLEFDGWEVPGYLTITETHHLIEEYQSTIRKYKYDVYYEFTITCQPGYVLGNIMIWINRKNDRYCFDEVSISSANYTLSRKTCMGGLNLIEYTISNSLPAANTVTIYTQEHYLYSSPVTNIAGDVGILDAQINVGEAEHTHHIAYTYQNNGKHSTSCDGEHECWGYHSDTHDCVYGESGEAYYTCQLCGGVNESRMPHIHDYNGEWHQSDSQHWKECQQTQGTCDARIGLLGDHEYSDNPADGEAYYTCSVCGYVCNERMPHIHDYSGEWHQSDSKHWKECQQTQGTCDAHANFIGDHEYSDNPADGEAYYTCSVCGYTDEERHFLQAHPESPTLDYLSLRAVGADMQIRFNKSSSLASELFMYSADKSHWLRTDIDDEQQDIVIPEGQTYYFRKYGIQVIDVLPWIIQMTPVNPEDTDATIEAGGNVMSLLDPSCQSLTVGDLGFFKLFSGCSVMSSAPYLPATELGNRCYERMFEGCAKLCALEVGAHSMPSYSYWLNGTAVGTYGVLTTPADFQLQSRLPLNWIAPSTHQTYINAIREEAAREVYAAPTETGRRMTIQLTNDKTYEFDTRNIESVDWKLVENEQ